MPSSPLALLHEELVRVAVPSRAPAMQAYMKSTMPYLGVGAVLIDPSKAELGEALIVRYSARFADALQGIDSSVPDAPAKLAAYASLYADVLRGERMCLCGILAAEYDTLPDAMREAVVRFFDENEVWLAGVLAEGDADQTLSFDGSSRDAAKTILSGLEGAMLVARPYGDMARFDAAAARLLAGLSK